MHITDVTNASRTQLMNLARPRLGRRDPRACSASRARCCPRSASSSEVYGEATAAPLRGVPVAGILGDQQAALVGQACFEPGEAKNTYGTGCFMLMNTGETPVPSTCGLLTTVAYKLGDARPRLCAGGLDRDHRRARAVAARQPRADPARAPRSRRSPARSRTTAASTSCRRSRASTPRTGTRGARGVDRRPHALRQPGPHRPRRARSRPPSRPARSRRDGAGRRRRGRRAARSTAAWRSTTC